MNPTTDYTTEFFDFCAEYMDWDLDPDFEYCWERMLEFDEDAQVSTIEYYLIRLNQNDFDKIVNEELGGVWIMIQKIKEYYCEDFMGYILKSAFLNSPNEPDFHFQLVYYYYDKVLLPDAEKYVKEKFIFYRRLHYNRFLTESCLPDEICCMIREYL